jgi:hypothetical protein
VVTYTLEATKSHDAGLLSWNQLKGSSKLAKDVVPGHNTATKIPWIFSSYCCCYFWILRCVKGRTRLKNGLDNRNLKNSSSIILPKDHKSMELDGKISDTRFCRRIWQGSILIGNISLLPTIIRPSNDHECPSITYDSFYIARRGG